MTSDTPAAVGLDRQIATVDDERLAGDVRRGRGGEEDAR